KMKLNELDTCIKGGPVHLINATANRMGHRNDPDVDARSRFTLSQLYCGTNKLGFRETSEFHQGEMRVADAVAISGAAVTVMVGGNLLAGLILFLSNLRLGQWLRNPEEYDVDHYWPSPLLALTQLSRLPKQRKYMFVSDGGHLDNTGLSALLERRCRLMIFADASFDPASDFGNLRQVLQAARSKYGIYVEKVYIAKNGSCEVVEGNESCFAALKPDANTGLTDAHFLVFRLRYPSDDPYKPGEMATLFATKTSITGDEAPELVAMASSAASEFPNHPTTDQFLPADLFEAYVELGYHVANDLDRTVASKCIPDGVIPQFMVDGITNRFCHLSHERFLRYIQGDYKRETVNEVIRRLSEAVTAEISEQPDASDAIQDIGDFKGWVSELSSQSSEPRNAFRTGIEKLANSVSLTDVDFNDQSKTELDCFDELQNRVEKAREANMQNNDSET
ncbi:MAG: hypothetical protein AAF497_01400, partial [Planctomycetota bacterium]